MDEEDKSPDVLSSRGIQFPDDNDITVHRTRSREYQRSETSLSRGVHLSDDNAFQNLRQNPASPFVLRRQHSRSLRAQIGEDEVVNIRGLGDIGHKQEFKGSMLLWLAYQSTGVIYGDIGTSPLYVFSSTFTEPPSKQDLKGVLSLVLWSLIMMVTVKYILVILWADNEGEGGTFSTYSLLCRYMNIGPRDPREANTIKIERYLSNDLGGSSNKLRSRIETSKVARGLLKVMGVLAVTMVLADGVLTPAQSVLGAIQGIEVVHPSISKGVIIGTTDGILAILFFIQPFGVTKLSYAFAPIIIIWLGMNAVFGIYNLVNYDASVFSAFNPGLAFEYLIRHKEQGWRSLGGVLLAFTGVEALFADLGAFSRRAIQLSWLCYILPCLLLAYTGQAAYISHHPEAYSNPFFNAAPPGTIYPALIIAILAAIVASQAIITATFQLLSQVMKLSYFPQIKLVHTSTIFYGQLFIPLANWTLMVGTILVASIYNNTTSLGNAYGVCVMFVTFFDTCMVSLAAIFVWRISPWIVVLPWLAIASMDGTFLSSALTKVPDGAWFTITLAAVMAGLLLLWRYGKESQWQAEADTRFPTSHYVAERPDQTLCLTEVYGSHSLSDLRGFCVFFDKGGTLSPTVFSQFLLKLNALPEVSVFLHLKPLEMPSVEPQDRYIVIRMAVPGCYRLIVRYGYNDEIITPNLSGIIYEKVKAFLAAKLPVVRDEGTLADTLVGQYSAELAKLEKAYETRVLYVMGKQQMKIKPNTKIGRKLLLAIFLWIRENTRGKMANLAVPADDIIEIGFLNAI